MKTLLSILALSLLASVLWAQSSLRLDVYNGSSFGEVSVPLGNNSLLGFGATGTPTRLTLGSGLTLTGTTLSAAGGVSSISASGGSTGLTLTGGPITSSGTLTLGGTLAIANGGTGGTSIAGARSGLNLVPGVHVQSYSLMLTRLSGLSVAAGASGSMAGDFVMGQGTSNGSATPGAAGGIYMTSGSGYENLYVGGDAGKIRMLGSDATSTDTGSQAGSIDTSAFGGYRGGNITTAALDGTGRAGGGIDTSAGGSLTMSEHDVTGPTVSGTILTVDGSGAFLTDLNADNITTGTINADRIPSALTGKTLTGIASLNLSDGATKDAQMSPTGLSFSDSDSGQLVSIEPPATGNQIFLTWPSATGVLLTNNSSLPAANLTGTIATARLPTTITGLTSVTSTTFVGTLTGTASGNLIAGGALGTPSSATLTNATGLPPAGVVGTAATLGANTFTSSQTLSSGRIIVAASSTAAAPAFTFSNISQGGWYAPGTSGTVYYGGSNMGVQFGLVPNGNFKIGYSGNIGFCSGAADLAADAFLGRVAGNNLAQYNTTNAQLFAVANTWASLTNNEIGVLDWRTTTNVLRIGSSKGSGGGSNREVRFIMGDTAKITLDTAGNVIVSGLPTTAPATSGALWRDAANGNVIKIVP